MAKAKAVPRKRKRATTIPAAPAGGANRRRPYEYDHHYGLTLQRRTAIKASGSVAPGGTSPGPARSLKPKSAAKKQ